ncbi:hypothetical protein [Mycobacterium riyadhense]|uniref:Uncharacterized protein n=1 Tax=Mycobacterium riyadhense TaxID=486698 RepID=A0A653F2S4_9MYCO|nr:hypothetical protein [Mycobacterium riyadhense]VTP03326.1 hypothetical protein BIN_B_04986 [Mycobacterium riyadhense]
MPTVLPASRARSLGDHGRIHEDPGIVAGICEADLLRRFPSWQLRTGAPVPVGDLQRHTHIPYPIKVGLRTGRLEIRRFELSRVTQQ